MLNIGTTLKDLDWVHIPSLKIFRYQIYHITVEQYVELMRKIPECFKNLLQLDLKINEFQANKVSVL